VAPGEKLATTDPDVAHSLAAARVKDLDSRRRMRALHGIAKQATLAAFARDHLIAKKRSGRVTDQWLETAEMHLRRAVEFFGPDRALGALAVEDVGRWAAHLSSTGRGYHGSTMSGGTVRHHLNTLSNLYRRAQAEGYVVPGYNPVGAMMEKPAATRKEAKWLEVPDAALLLESARTLPAPRSDALGAAFVYPLIATFLLTGGRLREVLGLEVDDVSFDRRTVTFRPNHWRRLKTSTSWRVIPLWPQLEAILRAYVFGAGAPPGKLLFPSLATGKEVMLQEPRKLVDRTALRAGWQPGEIRSKMLRHTYCAARLQTLDRGAPISPYTVGKELGHGGDALVRRVYGHLGQVRHRSEVVEYRVGQHLAVLQSRLTRLGDTSSEEVSDRV
jgi:integrase